MRILRVAQKLYPDVKGGGPYHVHALSRDQARKGHEVTVLTVGGGPPREHRDGYEIRRCPSWFSLLGNDVAPCVWRELRTADAPDVIHAHSHLYLSTNFAALRRQLGEVPLALTNHGLYSQTAPRWIFEAYLHTLGRWTFNSADVVLCYSSEDRKRMRQLGVTTPIEVVPNGIDTDRFTPDGRKHLKISGEPVILFVGRLVKGKRPKDAIETLDRVLDRYPNANLVFCGDGPLRKSMEREIDERGIDDSVSFLGQVQYDLMPAIYRAADVLLLPSEAEGLPRTILEAFACGLPVAASDLPNIADVVTKGGRVVPVGATDEFSTAVCELYSARHTAQEGREYVRSKHDWVRTVRNTNEVLTRFA